ncbi:MAG TPA: Sec-independent protein translocase protein TatB [Pseudolabrys sp.]|nr:Sec-independent protein translocase protein TatB [Pseudolabrys sp.]
MFDIGWGELVVVGIVALIAIGPKELPTVLRTLGQYMAKIRSMASEFQGQFQEALREAEMADLKKHADDLNAAVSDIGNFDPVASTQKQLESALEDKPESVAAESETADDAAASHKPLDIEPVPAEPVTAQTLPEPSVPLPEPAEPVTEKDFSVAEAIPQKQAGGAA